MAVKQRGSENDVVYGVKQVCALYGVEVLRMQSRVFTVKGAAGRDRPMVVGGWRDQHGKDHAGGMADLLARPRVPMERLLADCLEKTFDWKTAPAGANQILRVTVPLWIETKCGSNPVTYDQAAFKNYVEWNGEAWLLVRDSLDPLVEWLDKHGVKK